VAKAPSTSAPPTTNGVDKLYHQLAEIHAITIAQLAECTRWSRSDSTPSPIRVGTSRQGPDKMPSMTSGAPSPPTDFFPQASLWR
jgi:hypothetical protein